MTSAEVGFFITAVLAINSVLLIPINHVFPHDALLLMYCCNVCRSKALDTEIFYTRQEFTELAYD